jgi:AraC-like DNA-binding protein
MESLNIRDRNPGFDEKNFVPGHPCQINSQKVMTTIKHRMAVQKILDLIEAKLHDPPTLDELAFLAGLSRSYFSSVFKEVVGMRLQDYLFQARINKAKDLLSDINLTIKQVAYKVGFRDPDHFSRTFKKKTGITPTNWRLEKVGNSPLNVSFVKTK